MFQFLPVPSAQVIVLNNSERFQRTVLKLLLGLFILPALLTAETLTVALIRVSFEPDSSTATAGDGQFLLMDPDLATCDNWVLDPPPHDQAYFESHLAAANNYWSDVSSGEVTIDLENSQVFPDTPNGSYQVGQQMDHYRPFLTEFDETERLIAFLSDAVALADDDVDFSHSTFTTFMFVHAGMSGDFAFDLDPTPSNIPSAYLNADDLAEYGGIMTGEGALAHAIILPESQNFQQYEETASLFEDTEDPCFYQVALNGTLALLMGFHLGLPPMYDTEDGTSLLGGFALMDQGSNNWHGIAPTFPNPLTRIRMNWTTPVIGSIGDDWTLVVGDPPVKVPIADDEYYLIENRQRNLLEPDGMIEWLDTLAYDTISVLLDDNGVVLDVDERDGGLPASGLLIWHVDESAEFTAENPNGGSVQLIDLVEADGSQDMGIQTNLLFADFLETGWWFDAWYAGNEAWYDLNRREPVIGDSLLRFTPHTNPNTDSNDGRPSHLRIQDISRRGSTMSFKIRSDRFVDVSDLDEIVGYRPMSAAHEPLLYAFADDSLRAFRIMDDVLAAGPGPVLSRGELSSTAGGRTDHFLYPYYVVERATGVTITDVRDGDRFDLPGNNAIFRLQGDSTGMLILTDEAPFQVRQIDFLNQDAATILEADEKIIFFRSADQYATATQLIQGSSQIEILPYVPPISVIQSNGSSSELQLAENRDHDLYLSGKTIELPARPDHFIPLDADRDGRVEVLVADSRNWRILGTNGVIWEGNPVSHDGIEASPLVADFLRRGDQQIWLSNYRSYQVLDVNGKLLEEGVLADSLDREAQPFVIAKPDQYLVAFTGQQPLLMRFESGLEDGGAVWMQAHGSERGDRVITLEPPTGSVFTVGLKTESVYNYPNPAKSDHTTFRAWVGDEDIWKIQVFTLGGHQVLDQEVEVLLPNAPQEWEWDLSSVGSGVYVAKVSAGSDHAIIKVAVMR